jgi:sarcosine oxidase subunit alpha
MSVREGHICGVPTRLFRVSFTGELGYEINVPADYGASIWQTLQAGNVTPYGTEAMHVLRAEKGYIIIGQETDGTVIPSDLGLDWTIARAKRDFVGKRSLARPEMLRSDRQQLVGLLSAELLEEGAQVIADGVGIGHITSAYWSETLRSPMALGLIEGGRSRIRQIVHVMLQDHAVAVRVAGPVFYDTQGVRLHV